MIDVLLGLGSNKSFCGMESLEILARACAALKDFVCCPCFSSIYETAPMYVAEQERFLNLAVRGTVPDSLTPFELLDFIHALEGRFGRDRTQEVRFGARTLDIDIEEFGALRMESELLTIPHPRMHERQFVLVPILELLADSADFLHKKRLSGYLKALPEQGVKKCPDTVQAHFTELLKS